MKRFEKYLVPVIFLLLLALPLVFRGSNYFVGGDDMRLYYLFPEKYLENYAFNLVSGNTLAGAQTGYTSVAYYAPFFYLIFILKKLSFFNVQNLLFGLNISLGFLFFYKILTLFTNEEENISAKIAASSFYVLSPFLAFTLLKHQMLNQYLVSLMPAVFYFFTMSVLKNKFYLLVFAVLLFSIFSTGLNTLPWVAGFLIAVTPLFLFIFLKNKRLFIRNVFLVLILYLLVNIYWLFHIFYPIISATNIGSLQYYGTADFINDNLRIIAGVSRLYQPVDVIFNNADFAVEIFNLPLVLNLFFILAIFFGGVLIIVNKDKLKRLYLFSTISFLLSWYLFSPNIGSWGPELFLKVAKSIPFLTMFRNMHDKFALPLAFNFALLFGISLIFVQKYFRKYTARSGAILFFVTFTILLQNSKAVLVETNKDSYQAFSGEFNSNFIELTNFLEQRQDNGKVVWLPLNFPTYINVKDAKDEQKYYSGLSPMRILIDRDDLAGNFSFMTDSDLFLGYEVFDLIESEEYGKVGKLLQNFNVGYIVVRNEELPDELKSFMYGGKGYPLLKIQTDEFINNIIGEKLAVFGNEYTLYRINDKYQSEKIFLTQDFVKPYDKYEKLEYRLSELNEYSVELVPTQKEFSIVLMEPYSSYWQLEVEDIQGLDILEQQRIGLYSNGWKVHVDESGINKPLLLKINFTPSKYVVILNTLSVVILFLMSLYIAYYFIKDGMRKVSKQ